jgi:hypothetical protein
MPRGLGGNSSIRQSEPPDLAGAPVGTLGTALELGLIRQPRWALIDLLTY